MSTPHTAPTPDRSRGRRHLEVATDAHHRDQLEELLTSTEVCTYAGITYRQLDYWTRTRSIKPFTHPRPGSGHQRLYTTAEADVALTMRHLIEAGIDPRRAARITRQVLAGGTPRIGVFALVCIPGDLPPDGDRP